MPILRLANLIDGSPAGARQRCLAGRARARDRPLFRSLPRLGRHRCRRRGRARPVAPRRLGRHTRRTARRAAAAPGRSDRSATGGIRCAGIARQRQAAGAGARARHSPRHQQPALFRRRGHRLGQRVARHGKRRTRQRRHQLHLAPAAGRGGLHQSVEPAALPVHLEDRTRAGRRQHGGGQAVGSHALHRRAAGRAEHRGRVSRRRAEHRARPRPRAWARRSWSTRRSRRSPSPAAPPPARRSQRTAAPQFKKVSLEMGGKNPAIVFADADLSDANLDTIVRSGFANQGEICLCGSRLLVQRSIYETFRERYLARVQGPARRRSGRCRQRSGRGGLAAHITTRCSAASSRRATKAAGCCAAATAITLTGAAPTAGSSPRR